MFLSHVPSPQIWEDLMGSNSAHCCFVPTTCFSLGPRVSNQTSEPVPGVGLWEKQRSSTSIKPWANFVKEQEQHKLFKLWENELCFFIYI